MKGSLAVFQRRTASSEDGFTIVEIAVASAVVLTALVLMAGVLTAGLTGTAVARERQTANGIANQTLEKIRALPFETLRRGLDSADLAATAGTIDQQLSTSGCGAGAYCFQGERVVASTNTAVDPLVPHRRTITSSDATGKTFTLSAYVTYHDNNLTSNIYRVTTHVTWTSAVRGGSAQDVQAQTLIFPNGCASLPSHPYSGPCQSSYTSNAEAAPATVTASGHVAGTTISKAILSSGSMDSESTIEQTVRVNGRTTGAGATLQAVAGAEQETGYQHASSQADNDPGAAKSIYESNALPAQGAGSLALTSPTGSLTASNTAGSSGRSTSTTSASIAASRACPNITGITNENDSLPCGGSVAGTGAAVTLSSALNVGPLNAPAFSLASIGAQTSGSTAITDRAIASGVDTARATVTRNARNYTLGGLPDVALLKPVGFDHFVRINSHTDSATAVAGTGSTAPVAGATGGTLSFYTGALLSPYTTVNLSSLTTGSVPSIPTLNLNVPTLSTQVTLSAVITPESRSTTSSCTGTCSRTSASATVTPFKVSVTTKIVVSGATVLDVTTVLDPGTIQAKASHVPAPTG